MEISILVNYDFRLILPPQVRKMSQSHKFMCGSKICIQDGTYQELLNHWHKLQFIYINNNENSLTRVSDEQLNADNIFPGIVMLYYLMDNQSIHMLKILHFPVCVNLLKNVSSCQSGHVC